MVSMLLALLLGIRVAAPVIAPAEGTYNDSAQIVVTSSAAGVATYCARDAEPRRSGAQRVAHPSATWQITDSQTIACRSYALDGREPSRITRAAYTIQPSGNFYGLTIPDRLPDQPSPRVWFSGSRLSQAQTWYTTHTYTPAAPPGITAADYEGLDSLAWPLLAFQANPSGAATHARAWINWALAQPVTLCTPSNPTSDDPRSYGEPKILVYDWLYHWMTPPERATLRADNLAWLQNWAQSFCWGIGVPDSNYFLAYARNQLEWALAVHGDDNTSAEWAANEVISNLTNLVHGSMQSGRMRGGAGREGSMYGRHHFGYLAIPHISWEMLGRDLLEEPGNYWHEVVYWIIYNAFPARTYYVNHSTGSSVDIGLGRSWPMNDNSATGAGWESRFGVHPETSRYMATAALKWATDPIGQHARQWLNATSTPLQNRLMLAVDPGSQAAPLTTLPLDYYTPGSKYLYTKNDWSETGTNVWLQLGESGTSDTLGKATGHTHQDTGSFQIWRAGRFLSRESPAYVNTLTGYNGVGATSVTLGLAHNVLLINGNAVLGPTIWANYNVSNAVPVVRRLESQPGYSFASADFTPMITGAETPPPDWQHWERDFVFVRDLETLLVLDRVQSNDASDVKSFLLHSETNPTTGNSTATITNSGQQLVMTTLVPAGLGPPRVVDEGTNRPVYQYRIEVDTAPAAQSYILTVLEAKPQADTPLAPSVSDTTCAGSPCYVVTLDANHSVTFLKGMVSSGGSVTISGVTTNLREDVQSIAVTRNGPVWESSGTTWNVGPGRTYTTINAIQAVVQPGDTVLVDGNVTYGAATLSTAGTAQAPITYRGVRVNGNRPKLATNGSGNSVLAGNASHVIVEGFELDGSDGAGDTSPNRAGRCFRHQANNVTLRDVYLHHCLQGILGTDKGSGSLTAEFVEVAYCGNGIGQHGVYMATDEVAYPGSVFRLQYSYLHNSTGGNGARSRAERNEIYYNWFQDGYYREWESLGPDPQAWLPGEGWSDALVREDSDIVGNVFWKTTTNSSAIMRLGGDGTGRTFGRKRIVGNTFIMGPGTGSSGIINLFENIDSIELHNNVFYRTDGAGLTVINDSAAAWVAGRAVAGTSNWVPTGSVSPAEWTDTVTGTTPGFTNIGGYDIKPTAGSPLVNAGGPATTYPAGHPFPNPLPVPLYAPPQRTTAATSRGTTGVIDIGAYEYTTP